MPRRIRVYPYKPYSESAKILAEHLGAKRIKHEGSLFVPRKEDIVINWGASDMPAELSHGRVLNHPIHTTQVQCKKQFFEGVHLNWGNFKTPDYFFNKDDAKAFMKKTNSAVVCRTVLTGHSGRGIVYCATPDELVDASLYVQYVKKASEFRVHLVAPSFKETGRFCRGNYYTFIQRKARRKDIPDDKVDWKIRNLAGGFIYANDPENVGNVPDSVIGQAQAAMRASGLHFGAVDVIYNKKKGEAYVLEINTAPGLVGKTGEFYRNSIKELVANS